MLARPDRCLLKVYLMVAATLVVAGCGQEPQIRSYEVPRDAQVAADPTPSDGTPSIGIPTRMIAAVIPGESQAWFVKTTGPEAALDAVADDVRNFIREMEISTDDPNALEWDAPAEWRDGGERMMREATLVLPAGDPPLEVAISKLGYDGNRQPYLLANINRWRGQLGLEPRDKLDDMTNVSKVEITRGEAWIFDAVGTMDGSGMRPPMGGGQAPMPSDAQVAADPTSPPPAIVQAKPEIKFDVPDDWQELARGSMGSRSYQVASGDEHVTVKLSDFPPVGNMADPLENINRWRGQYDQPPLDEDSVKQHSEAVDIGGADGVLTTIERPDQSEAMLAAMVVELRHVWFFQLSGTPQGVAAHREEFLKWLGTVEFVPAGPREEKQ
jgi:hypothetical protein